MSKKINEDIKKWHREIGELIINKNVKNYDYTFVVPNNNTLHELGHGSRKTTFANKCLLFEEGLLNYLLHKYSTPHTPKDRFLISIEIDDWFNLIKDGINQKIKNLEKESKRSAPISLFKKGGEA